MSNLDSERVIHHFAHQHPLELLNFQPQSTQKITCSCCKRDASGWTYHCNICNYYLHKTCSKMPQTLSHSIDQNHELTLLSSPAYPQGSFMCNACGTHGTGFCYHCKECQIDLHTICAFMPSKINHTVHNHTLHLFFSPPYDGKTFLCDICHGTGLDHWLYRCDSCEFDAHMKCAKAKTQPRPILPSSQRQEPQFGKSKSVPTQTTHNFSPRNQFSSIPYVHTTQYPVHGIGFSDGGQSSSQLNRQLTAPILPQRTNSVVINDVIGHAIEGITGAITQEVVQALVQGTLGGS